MVIGLLFLIFFVQTGLAKSVLSNDAEKVLNSVEYNMPAPSIIGKREWKELELDRLVTILDRSKTAFGRWGLVQLLHPVADEKELSRRKKIITFLINHEEEMQVFQEQLERVRGVEKSLLAYWDAHDQLNQNVHQFYYTTIGLRELNKSSLALNISTVMEMFNSWKYLMTMLAFGGVSAEYTRWLYGGEKFDIIRGLKAGLAEPLKQHSPELSVLKNPEATAYTYKDYIRAVGGSWGDRYTIARKGYIVDKENLGVLSWFAPSDTSLNPVSAFISATIPTLLFDYQWGSAIVSTGKRIISMYQTLNELQQRISDVAHCIDAIQKLNALVVKRSPTLRSYLEEEEGYEGESKEIINALLANRFLKKSDHLYSRGHVLTMHLDLVKKKKELIPLLHSVAFLDAYCSIAQLYKENQNKSIVFSFPEFIDSKKPLINYQTAWLPLLPVTQAISNDLILGGQKAEKIIITGPNGGGKSTILKTLAIGPLLAQSWCIVPAQHAQQTILSAIRTALAPREDLEQGLSTFMAEKKTMLELFEDIRNSKPNEHTLVLVDEPYKGTVDAESAKRIYQFGKDVAQYPQVLIAIATHVEKPIKLAQDTAGIFENYQVKIEETALGSFKRLFKLEPGPATWWFEDAEKRSRFVDWISVKSNMNG